MEKSVEAKRIWDYHMSQGRHAENPPILLAEARQNENWVRVWVTGLDTTAWYYEINNTSNIPRLIAVNMNTESDQGLLIGDRLLVDAMGQRKFSHDRWQHYAIERLATIKK